MCGERKDTLPQTKTFDLSVCLQSVFPFLFILCTNSSTLFLQMPMTTLSLSREYKLNSVKPKIFDLSVYSQSVFLFFVTFSCISYLSAHTSCAIGKAAHTLGQPA